MPVQQPGCFGDGGVGADGDGGSGHQLGRGVAGSLGPLHTLAVALEQAPARRALGERLLEQQIGLGHDPGQPPVVVQDR